MKKITRDKWKHFYVAIPLGAVFFILTNWYWPLQPVMAFVVSSAALVAVCYGFELFSKITGWGRYEMADAVAGIIGGIIGIGIVLLARGLWR